jgi:hypothetical protein
MRIEITRNVMINGEPVKAGSFVEVELNIANLLIGSDKAKAEAGDPAEACQVRTKACCSTRATENRFW